jgi:hypothetical protein
MLYVGDALLPGENDAPARETGAVCIEVPDPHETKRVIACASETAKGRTAAYEGRGSRSTSSAFRL